MGSGGAFVRPERALHIASARPRAHELGVPTEPIAHQPVEQPHLSSPPVASGPAKSFKNGSCRASYVPSSMSMPQERRAAIALLIRGLAPLLTVCAGWSGAAGARGPSGGGGAWCCLGGGGGRGGFPRLPAAAGVMIGAVLALGILTGWLRLTVGGIVIVTLLQGIWILLVVWHLLRGGAVGRAP